MDLEHQNIKIDINSLHAPSVRLIESVNDKGIRYAEVEFYSNSIKLSIPDSITATATFVTDGKLISDEVSCTIKDGNVIVPIDNKEISTRSGIMLVEVTIKDESGETSTILNTPHAFKIRVTPSIKDNAQITENSLGTTAEILKEVALARGNFKNLDERLKSKVDKDDVYTAEEADEHFLSAVEPGGSVESKHIKNKAVNEDKLSDEVVEKINSKAKESLFLKQSSTQLIKLADVDTTINGLHIVINNNHITVSGTTTKGYYERIAIDAGLSQFEADTDYTLSIQNIVDKSGTNFGLFCNSQPIPIWDYENSKTMRFDTTTDLVLNWNINPGEYDKEFDFKIEFGTERTIFEPFYVVASVANGSISKEKLSEDVQNNLSTINAELPNKAEMSSLLNKTSYFEFKDISEFNGANGEPITIETGYYYGIFTHNTTAGFECTSVPIECKEGDIFRITSATTNSDNHQAVIKCYDENQVLISSYFEGTGNEIKLFTDKIFIVPKNVAYIAFNCRTTYNDLKIYSLKVEKAVPYTNQYGLIANTLVHSLPSATIFGANLIAEGDSIVQGTGAGNRSFVHLIADKYNMNLTCYAVGNTTLAVHPDNGNIKDSEGNPSTSICERILNNISIDTPCDFFIFDGGTNDNTKKIPLGVITDGINEEFDTTTILGALEAICLHLNTTQLTAKKLFVFPASRVEMLKITNEVHAEMKKVLCKYGIPYIDLSDINSLGHWNSDVAEKYYAKIKDTNGKEVPDPLHPNIEGHRIFYLPCIEKALLFGGYIGSGGSADSSSGNGSYTLTEADISTITNKVLENFINVSEVGL